MKGRRLVVAVTMGASLAVLSGLSGCVGVACAGASSEPPHVELDISKWRAVHPDLILKACFDGECQTARGEEDGYRFQLTTQAGDDTEHPERPYKFTVTVSATGGVLSEDDLTVQLIKHVEPTACGPFTQWRTDAILTDDGRISLNKLADGSLAS